MAATDYFEGNKADKNNETYETADCQPKFLIEITDGMGNTGSTAENRRTRAEALADADVTGIGVGFGLAYADVFTTFIPDENVCSGSGETYVFALDYKTGLSPLAPIFDLDGDEEFGEDDKITVDAEKIIPVGKYVGRGRGSKPVLHGDVLFITTTDSDLVVDDENGGGGGQKFFAEKINIPAQKVRLEAWRHQ